ALPGSAREDGPDPRATAGRGPGFWGRCWRGPAWLGPGWPPLTCPRFTPFPGADCPTGPSPDTSITGNRSHTRAHVVNDAGQVAVRQLTLSGRALPAGHGAGRRSGALGLAPRHAARRGRP